MGIAIVFGMTQSIAQQIDREAELLLVAASRGQIALESALIQASAALAAWAELGEAYWPERSYWEMSIAYARRTGRAS